MNLSKAALAILSLATVSPPSVLRWGCSAFLVASPVAAGRPNYGGRLFLFDKLFSTSSSTGTGKFPVLADESVMDPKAHGTSEKPVQTKLRWNCDVETADRISNFNRHYAEVRADL
jgi:hypothetical protein